MGFHRLALDLDADRPLTDAELRSVEKFADKLFAKVGLDIRFTKHFMERVNDTRNVKQITIRELATFFHDAFKKYGTVLDDLPPGMEAVLTDADTFINMPFAIDFNPRTRELELVSKTVMRKRNFHTPSKRFLF